MNAPRTAPFLLLAVFATAGAPLGAGPEGVQPPSAWERLKQEWSEFLDALADYTAAQREGALAESQQLLEALDRQIAELREEAERHGSEISAEARRKAMEAMETLKRRREELALWYERMKAASGKQWEHARQRFSQAYEEAERAVDEMLRDRQAPRSPEDTPLESPTPI